MILDLKKTKIKIFCQFTFYMNIRFISDNLFKSKDNVMSFLMLIDNLFVFSHSTNKFISTFIPFTKISVEFPVKNTLVSSANNNENKILKLHRSLT